MAADGANFRAGISGRDFWGTNGSGLNKGRGLRWGLRCRRAAGGAKMLAGSHKATAGRAVIAARLLLLPGLAAGLYLPKSVWTLEQEPLC